MITRKPNLHMYRSMQRALIQRLNNPATNDKLKLTLSQALEGVNILLDRHHDPYRKLSRKMYQKYLSTNRKKD